MKRVLTQEEKQKLWDFYNEFRKHPVFDELFGIKQHRTSNTYRHVCLVTRRALTLAMKNNMDIDYYSLIRGGLLHDLFYYDWRNNKKMVWGHGFTHPVIALRNASKYFDLNPIEKDIIRNHMWPLTLFHMPQTKEGRLISWVDKEITTFEALSKKKDAVIFDFDGTLFDTIEDVYESLNYSLTKNNKPNITREQLRLRMGYKMSETIQLFLGIDCQEDEVNQIIKDYREYYDAHNAVHVKPYPGMLEALRELRRNGYVLGVSTNKKESVAREIIDKFYPHIFSYIQGDDGVTPLKPDPTSINIIKKQILPIIIKLYFINFYFNY